MGLSERRDKIIGKLQSKMAEGDDPEGWLEGLKSTLDGAIARHGIDSKQSRRARILVCDLLHDLGRFDEERLLWEAQVQSVQRAKGDNEIEIAFDEGRLALDLGLLGEYEQAKVILERVYVVLTSKLGPEHERTLWVKQQIETVDEHLDESS
jgi:hypothetical protein